MQPKPRSPVAGVVALGGGLAIAWAGVGLPLVALGAGQILAWAHRLPRGEAIDKRALVAGWVAVLILCEAVITGGVFGISVVELVGAASASSDTGIAATAVIAPLAAGLLFAPLALAPSLALQDSRSAWIVESVWLSAHRGALRTALVGLGLGAHGALPFAMAWLCAEMIDDDLAALALLAGCGLTVLLAPVSLEWLAGAFTRAQERAADPANAERSLGSLGRLAILPLTVLGVVIAICAAAPAPLPEAPMQRDTVALPVTLPGTDVEIDTSYRGVIVRADGESTQHPTGGWLWDATAHLGSVRVGGERAWRITVQNDGGAVELIVDDRGRRLDDSIARRITARIPDAMLALLALASLVGVVFAARARRVSATVRTLATSIGGGGHDVIAGTLALRSAAPRVVSGQLIGGAGAALESEGGALRIALPDAPVPVLAIDPSVPRELAEGTPAMLVSRGARLGGVGMRDATSPFPAGGALVIGDAERGRAALVRAAFPVLVRLGLAIGALVVLATFALAAATP